MVIYALVKSKQKELHTEQDEFKDTTNTSIQVTVLVSYFYPSLFFSFFIEWYFYNPGSETSLIQ
ncbi:MAG: hypothetical protein WC525_03860 [Candidatus Thermoplasmatota archaeon]